MSDENLKQQIESLVEARRDEIVESMQAILRFPTVSGAPDEAGQQLYKEQIAACMSYLEDLSGRLGFQWKNRDNIYAYSDLEGGPTFVGLPVHIDVVPPGEDWTQEPFGGEIVDDVIYGRGCQDDKGPVVQMYFATAILKELGGNLRRGARIIIGTTEEFGEWFDMKMYRDEEAAPEISIVSDAAFPIINGEKGVVNFRVEGTLPELPEPEAGEFTFHSAMSGERTNIVPPKAKLLFTSRGEANPEALKNELERFLQSNAGTKAETKITTDRFEITFHGKGAHGSTPEEGHNAALDMLLFLTQTAFLGDDEADLAQFLYDCGKGIYGEKLNVNVTHDFIGRTTVNMGIVKWEGATFEAFYNTRNTMGLTVADTIKRAQGVVQEFAEETGFEISGDAYSKAMEPIYVDPKDHPEFIGSLQEAYQVMTGREPKLHAIGGTTYAKVFPNAVCFGPVDLEDEQELAHQADERIHIDHLLRNVKIYAYALAKLCRA